MDLNRTTRRKLQSAPRTLTLTKIAEATGLSIAWLSRFQHNKLATPGADKVKLLHDFLTGQN